MTDFDKVMQSGIDAEKHAQEIVSSRVGGFGGSDAKLFLNIARNGLNRLSKGDTERIAQAMSLVEYRSSVENAYTVAGHKFEDFVDELLNFVEHERETVLHKTLATNFKTFAHADFTINGGKVVYECKFFAKKTTEETLAEVMPQLQWYYMLGASSVYLVHGKGEAANGFEVKDVKFEPVQENEELIFELEKGIAILDKAITDGWQPVAPEAEDVPQELVLTWDAYWEAKKEIEAREADLKPFKEIAEKYEAEILEALSNSETKSVTRTKDGVTHTASIKITAGRRTFDSKKFLAQHPEYDRSEYYNTSKESVKLNIK